MKILAPLFSPTFYFCNYKLSDYLNVLEVSNVDLIVLPELASTGYYAKDFYLFPEKIEKLNKKFLDEIRNFFNNHNGYILTSLPLYTKNGLLVNSMVLINVQNKNITFDIIGAKKFLPNYNIFNEKRYFSPYNKPYSIITINGSKIGLFICEDAWYYKNWKQLIDENEDIDLIISVNASPYETGKLNKKIQMFKEYVTNSGIPFLYVNYYGSFDEITFDGDNFFINSSGQVFENVLYIDFDENKINRDRIIINQNNEQNKFKGIKNLNQVIEPIKTEFDQIQVKQISNEFAEYIINSKQNEIEQIVNIIRLNMKSYLKATGFNNVVIGISGGIDSAVVLYLAKELDINIYAYFLPIKPFTSDESYKAVDILRTETKIKIEEVDLTAAFNSVKDIMNINQELALANLQARLRANFLLTKANELNALVLVCSNKTELAYGYYTLGGDSEGGYAPLKDVLKTEVYQIAEYLGVPKYIINRKPTAELFTDKRTDEQELGISYEELDKHLKLLINDRIITDINRTILKFEFKRIQAPIGPKISSWSFNDDWKFPIFPL